MKKSSQNAWGRRVHELRRRVNTAVWLDIAAVPVFVACSLLGALCYAGRRISGIDWVWWLLSLGICVAAFLWVRRKAEGLLFTDRDARAYLDEQMELHAALSASTEVEMDLPPAPKHVRDCIKRNSRLPLYWLIGGFGMVAVAWWLPLPTFREVVLPVAIPPALEQVSDWLEEVEKQTDVAKESIEEFQQNMEELLAMSREEMYSHSGLEATDAMKENVSNAAGEFMRNMDSLSKGMEEAAAGGMNDMAALENLDKALASLDQSKLQPGGGLADQLKGMNAASLRQLSPEQMKRLQENLNKAASGMNSICKRALGNEMIDPDANPGKGRERGEGDDGGGGDAPGSGGVSRGRGDAPITFNPGEYESIDGKDNGMDSSNMERAGLGDKIGMRSGEHRDDPVSQQTSMETGTATHPAHGGEAAWRDNLTPAERDALKAVFK